MLAARATGTASLRSARSTTAFAVAAVRVAPRALSSKPPEKPVPSPEEEAAKQAAQMRALDVVLEAQNTAGEWAFMAWSLGLSPCLILPSNPRRTSAL